jgi:type III secretion protein U
MGEQQQHKPTQKKLDKARKEGQVVKAPAVGKVAAMLAIFPLIIRYLPAYWVENRILLEYCLNSVGTSVGSCMYHGSQLALFTVLACLSSASLGGIAVELFQVGWKPQASLLAPRLDRVNPVSGVKRLFQGFREVALRLPFVIGLAGVVAVFLTEELKNAILYTVNGVGIGKQGPIRAALIAVLGLSLYASAEYFLKRRRFFIDQSMSTQELRDEYKNSEGDPQLKGMRQSMHEELAMQEIVARVKTAKVIVVERT